MSRESVRSAIRSETSSDAEADAILKYVARDLSPPEGTEELVLVSEDEKGNVATAYSQRFGNLVFNWKKALVDGIPALLDLVNPNLLLAILKVGKAYRALVDLFNVPLGDDEAKVVKALWFDLAATGEVSTGEVAEKAGLAADQTKKALGNLERLKIVSFTATGRILRVDEIRVVRKGASKE